MSYEVYVRRLPLIEWENRNDQSNLVESELKLYAILENFEDIEVMCARFKKRAEVINIKVFIIPYGKREVVVTFYSAVLGLQDILYDPFTFDFNTVYRKPNKPEILDTVKLADETTFLIATHTIEEFIDLNGLDSDFSIKNVVFSQIDFTLRHFRRQQDVYFMNKMKTLLNQEGIVVAVGISNLEFNAMRDVYAYIVLLYTDKSYDETFETFKRYATQIEEMLEEKKVETEASGNTFMFDVDVPSILGSTIIHYDVNCYDVFIDKDLPSDIINRNIKIYEAMKENEKVSINFYVVPAYVIKKLDDSTHERIS